MSKTGKLSINSENMLPIIKKWLYSDHDSVSTDRRKSTNTKFMSL